MGEDLVVTQEFSGDNYGWCDLCHSFTEFPHVCEGHDRPIEEETAA